MPLYKKSQIAKIYGKSNGQVTNAVGRGVLVCTPDNYIDDSDDRNIKMLEKWKAALDAKGGVEKVTEEKKQRKKRLSNSDPADEPKAKTASETMADKKLAADLRYKEQQALNWELRNAKLKGENIPVVLVEGIIKMLAHSFQTKYKNNALNILTEVSHKTKMSDKDFAKFKGKLFDSINKSHRSAINETKRGIGTVISSAKETTDDDESE